MNTKKPDLNKALFACGVFCLLWWLTIAAYWISVGEPFHLLWLCDLTLLVSGIGLILKIPVLLSSQIIGTLPIQIAWNIDFWLRVATGSKIFGFTEYMFSPSHPTEVKILSTFHIFLPLFLIFALIRYGYDNRGWIWQSVLTVIVYSISYLATDAIQDINWTIGPFWKPQAALPESVYLVVWTMLTLFMYLIFHLFLTRFLKIRPSNKKTRLSAG